MNLKLFLATAITVLLLALDSNVRAATLFRDQIEPEYRNACGPIACYAVLQFFGYDYSVEHIARLCEWDPNSGTSLNGIEGALKKFELQVTPARVTPLQLMANLEEEHTVAILLVRDKGTEIDHAVCAFTSRDGEVSVVDFSQKVQVLDLANLTQIWDGQALLIAPTYWSGLTSQWYYYILPTVVLVLGIRSRV